MAQRALDLDSRSASAGDFDPFEEALGPTLTAKDFETKPSMRSPDKVDPFAAPAKRAKPANTEAMTRDLWRSRGYFYTKTEQLESHYGSSFPVKKDLFGIVDGIAVCPVCGDTVFVQATTVNGRSSHGTKLLTGTWKIGNGTPTKILDVVRALMIRSRVVFCCWEQPGGKGTRWVCHETEITEERIQAWMQRRKMSQ